MGKTLILRKYSVVKLELPDSHDVRFKQQAAPVNFDVIFGGGGVVCVCAEM
jgi:hypothetical protein